MRLMSPFSKKFFEGCGPPDFGYKKKTARTGRPSDLLLEGFFRGLGLFNLHGFFDFLEVILDE